MSVTTTGMNTVNVLFLDPGPGSFTFEATAEKLLGRCSGVSVGHLMDASSKTMLLRLGASWPSWRGLLHELIYIFTLYIVIIQILAASTRIETISSCKCEEQSLWKKGDVGRAEVEVRFLRLFTVFGNRKWRL